MARFRLYLGSKVAAAVVVVDETPAVVRRGAMYPGGWLPDRLYAPPRKKITKAKLKALKELYEEAREVIPEQLQRGLLPDLYLAKSQRVSAVLPPPSAVDFSALARSIDTIRVLIAAVQAAREAQRKETERKRREEETILALIMEIL